jgi:hypothetical protein
VSRPCRWPDGGCGAEILDVVTVKGAKQVLDATPEKRIIIVDSANYTDGEVQFHAPGPSHGPKAKVVNTYVDHHATCTAFAAKVERERAAKADRP